MKPDLIMFASYNSITKKIKSVKSTFSYTINLENLCIHIL